MNKFKSVFCQPKMVGMLILILVSWILLRGRLGNNQLGNNQSGIETKEQEEQEENVVNQQNQVSVGECQEEMVAIEGYGDNGKRLKNCFVEYPGESSRQDKSYYIVEDICGQFTKEFVQHALDKSIVRIESPEISGLYNCKYILNDQDDYVMLVLEYLSAENQKRGHEMMDRRIETSDKIPMTNMVVWQPDGLLNTVYLVLGDEKFISIERSSGSGLTAEELITFAGNIANGIKVYK